MRYTLLLFIVAEFFCSDPMTSLDISLNGKSLKNGTLTVFQFICSTNIAVWQCTAEFLIEERTHADIRYANYTCYHTDGICSSNLCACSESCKSFTWNVTITKDMKNHFYSCATRMVKEGVYYLAKVTVKWDGNDGFQTLHKNIVPINVVTQQPTTSKSKSDSVKWTIISTTVGLITCICTFIVLTLTCRKICISTQHEAPNASITAPSNGSFPDQTTEAPQSSKNVLSQVDTPEHRYTPDVNMKNNLAAQKCSKKELYSNHEFDYQAPHNSENTSSLSRTQKYRHTPAPQNRKNKPSLIGAQKCRHAPAAPQKSKNASPHFRTPKFRHPQDSNSTMNNSDVRAYYSALPGYRSSTSTHSSASGEGLSIYSIHVENRVLLHGQDLRESNA